MGLLDDVIAQGFDESYEDEHDHICVVCSQCEAMIINGVACHEPRCPNIVEDDGDDDWIDFDVNEDDKNWYDGDISDEEEL